MWKGMPVLLLLLLHYTLLADLRSIDFIRRAHSVLFLGRYSQTVIVTCGNDTAYGKPFAWNSLPILIFRVIFQYLNICRRSLQLVALVQYWHEGSKPRWPSLQLFTIPLQRFLSGRKASRSDPIDSIAS